VTCPVYPKPVKSKASLLKVFFQKRHSWLDALYERSYGMKMGEMKLPGLHLFMVNQLDLVRRVMHTEVDQFPKHRMLGDILEPLLGESIFTTNGSQWKKQRDMMDPAFRFARVQHVFGLMQEAVSEMEARLAGRQGEPWVDVDSEMTFVTADIIFRTIMSVSLGSEQGCKILEAFVLFQAESPKQALWSMFRLPTWLQRRGGERRRQEAAKLIRSSIADIIRPRYEQAQSVRRSAISGEEAVAEQDILASLLGAVDPDSGQPFGFDEVVDQVAMLFLAGHETSASALTWSLYLLATHPEVQEAAYAEVASVLEGRSLDVATLKQLVLVKDVFREALRLYPPVGFFARESQSATCMRDKQIGEGATIVVAPWLIHRHQDFWHRPHEFDPYRFSQGQLKTPLRDSYLPFGMGPRTCIGATFAQQEAVLILATLVRSYRFEMAPDFIPQPVGRLTIRSENGMRLILKAR